MSKQIIALVLFMSIVCGVFASPKIGGPTECVLCKFVISELDDLLQSNYTETKIIETLNKVCSYLPEKFVQMCDFFVDTYTDAIINYLVTFETPEQICEYLRLCDSSKVMQLKTTECTMCNFVINELVIFLENDYTETKIREGLDQACSYIPEKFVRMCDDFVNTYVEKIVDYLVTYETPEQLCEYIHMCPKSVIA